MNPADYLKLIKACDTAVEWAAGKSVEEIIDQCHRGDWLLWLAPRIGVDKRKVVLAAAMCANTVRHLMNDERSIAAVDVALKYGRGEVNEDEMNAAAYAAYAADAAAYADAYADAYAEHANIVRHAIRDVLINLFNSKL